MQSMKKKLNSRASSKNNIWKSNYNYNDKFLIVGYLVVYMNV